ncbi:hypothetical protein HMPREF3152_04265 [Actinomyces sp. HMSC06A08]|nr:hypothetical protein HMPREF3152_04265 [Actinomyces sp. HMSC06A08]
MGLGGSWEGTQLTEANKTQALAALRAAKEVGIGTIDTADIYKDGRADAAIGAALKADKELRSHFKIQTKFGIHLKGVPRYEQTSEHLKRSVAGSLERLGVDHLDTLLIHRPDPLADKQAVAKALTQLLEQKIVGQIGVSNMHSAQLRAWSKYVPLAVNQLQLSLGHHAFVDAEVDFNTPSQANFDPHTVEWCLEQNLKLQAWGPLDQGRFTKDHPQEGDQATARAVQKIARAQNQPAEAVVLAWLEKHPGRIEPIIGTTKPERIRACACSKQVRLDRSQWYELYQQARGRKIP